jgi:hypothetical protein
MRGSPELMRKDGLKAFLNKLEKRNIWSFKVDIVLTKFWPADTHHVTSLLKSGTAPKNDVFWAIWVRKSFLLYSNKSMDASKLYSWFHQDKIKF